jgi:putative peptide zinc metalloprotease protein
MASDGKTFSEVWYRVAGQAVVLAPQVRIRKQVFRGEIWYLVEDPFNNSFYRLRPEAYAFVGRLSKDRTVEEVWRECLELDPDGAPGQEEVIQLLGQLHHANLLHGSLPPDHVRIFERYRKRRQREKQFIWRHLMFARFPLWDPDAFLVRSLPLVRWMVRPWAVFLWLAVLVLAVKRLVEYPGGLGAQAMNLLAFENLLLLYTAIVLVKALHEFGHAYTCRLLGGEVHTMGLMLLVLSPLPYMDATASWAFRERWKRIAVASAGMVVELFVAALAALFWVAAADGAWRDLAFNIMVVASVSTLLFNLNPLLRYDGYYILADLIDVPNLHTRGQKHLRHLCERYLFGLRKSRSPANSLTEAFWLTTHGSLAGAYRTVVFAGIIFFVSTQYLLLGLLIALVCLISWLIIPAGKFIKYLSESPALQRNRSRAVLTTVGLAAALAAFLGAVPLPQSMRAPGVLQAETHAEVSAATAGGVAEIRVESGTRVEPGTPLIALHNFELERELDTVLARQRELQVLWRQALHQSGRELAAIEQAQEALLARQQRLEARVAGLVVRSPVAGIWTAPRSADLKGAWLERGAAVGHVVAGDRFVFSAIVSQRLVSRLFADETSRGRIRLAGQSRQAVPVERLVFIQAEQDRLPSAALSVAAGGSLAFDTTDREGTRAAESFFEVRAYPVFDHTVEARHGSTGTLRLQLPPEPLLQRVTRSLRQLFQAHFTL